MKAPPPSFAQARQKLLGEKPPGTVVVELASDLDLPDDFLCELGRLFVRFNKLESALFRVLDRPDDLANGSEGLEALRRRRFHELLLKHNNAAGEAYESSMSVSLFFDTFDAAKVMVGEFKNWEWAMPNSFTIGARLVNWPPVELDKQPVADELLDPLKVSRLSEAANDELLMRRHEGTPVTRREVENLSSICAYLYRELWELSNRGPSEHRVDTLPFPPKVK